ncbi:MAG: tRNA-specific adenosine deaminase, partial [Firmicutes bacterium]|nr:tRNA-specific adenosine deaminase [Bacillota bacterium]
VYIGTMDPKAGAAGSVLNVLQEPKLNHRVEIETGMMQEECSEILKSFFKGLRQKNKLSEEEIK